MKKILYIGIIIILFFSSFYTRFQNLGNFYTETDDQMPISQMLNYKRLDLYTIANDASSPSYNSYLKLKLSRNSLSLLLLCSEKDENFSKGSGIEDNGLSKFFSIKFLFGTLSGTFLNPSISSEKI